MIILNFFLNFHFMTVRHSRWWTRYMDPNSSRFSKKESKTFHGISPRINVSLWWYCQWHSWKCTWGRICCWHVDNKKWLSSRILWQRPERLPEVFRWTLQLWQWTFKLYPMSWKYNISHNRCNTAWFMQCMQKGSSWLWCMSSGFDSGCINKKTIDGVDMFFLQLGFKMPTFMSRISTYMGSQHKILCM